MVDQALNRATMTPFTAFLVKIVAAGAVASMTAAFAVPRFQVQEDSQRGVAVERFANSLEVATELSHGLWLSQGKPAFLVYGGSEIEMEAGYPTLTTVHRLAQARSALTYTGAGIWEHRNAVDPAGCRVRYRIPAESGGLPDIEVATAGC